MHQVQVTRHTVCHHRQVQAEPRHDFSYGFTTSRHTRMAVVIVIGVVGTPAGTVLGLVLGSLLVVANDPDGSDRSLIAVPVALGVLLALLFGAVALWYALRIVWMSAWLEGTRLTVRDRRTPVSADLARARTVTIAPTPNRWRVPGRTGAVPQLVVVGEGATVHMRLSTGEGLPLPPQDIDALVVALSRTPVAADAVRFLRTEY
jgi:hypothetical protein